MKFTQIKSETQKNGFSNAFAHFAFLKRINEEGIYSSDLVCEDAKKFAEEYGRGPLSSGWNSSLYYPVVSLSNAYEPYGFKIKKSGFDMALATKSDSDIAINVVHIDENYYVVNYDTLKSLIDKCGFTLAGLSSSYDSNKLYEAKLEFIKDIKKIIDPNAVSSEDIKLADYKIETTNACKTGILDRPNIKTQALSDFLAILNPHLIKINPKVVYHLTDGEYNPPKSDGSFHVWFFSTGRPAPTGVRGYSQIYVASGVMNRTAFNIPSRSYRCSMSPEFHEVKCERGYVHAYYFEQNLYIPCLDPLTNLTREFIASVGNNLVNMIMVVIDKVTSTGDIALATDELIRICSGRIESSKSNAINEKRNIDSTIDNLSKQLAECHRTLMQQNAIIEKLSSASIDKVSIQKEVEAIKKNSDVLSLTFVDNKLNIRTKTLYAENPTTGMTHEIGEFNIVLNFSTNEVRWHNLTRKVTTYVDANMNAPHVYSDGHACLGNAAVPLSTYMGRCEISMAAAVAIEFVQSVNMADNAGKCITMWPISERRAANGQS